MFYFCAPYVNGVVGVLQGGGDVEIRSTSECPATNGSDDVRDSVCNGVGVDAEWKHK